MIEFAPMAVDYEKEQMKTPYTAEVGDAREINKPDESANAYFHTIDELRNEVSKSGFAIKNSHAVEGCVWITPTLDDKWKDTGSRKRFLEIIHATEHEETLMGLSPHMMVVAEKTN